ncbi:ABC transporter substrate-binding protein [Candidatus Epulonipiscium viviparus]|uniref:ABC transporter substrate-binding protein n=1 Tax=Candidatus Epulonipiscium viviparus TaxID=420336 RepID=UPI0027380B35|nr:ABC transporter substrate-binding protein [Candidatus Epulopiscium viviparus]
MNLRKLLCIGFVATTMGALTACGGAEETAEVAAPVAEVTEVAAPVSAETEEPVRDLGGLVVTIASWADVVEPEEKNSAQEEALWEYRHEMMEKHNFQFEELALGTWDGILELMSTSSLAGEPAAEVFRMQANFNVSAKNSGLAYDLSTLDSIDLSEPKWSSTLNELMSDGDSIYGLAKFGRPSGVLYFNKRILEDAGIDPDSIYDMQANKTWTWDAFMDISEKVTQDIDNDGLNDIYALPMQSGNFVRAAMFSNGGSYLTIDEEGNYQYNLMSPESYEAFEWAADYWQTDYDVYPSHWNGHKEMFTSGKTAFFLGDEWEIVTLTQDKMTDDWGMVAFPLGPKGKNYVGLYNDAAWVIPNVYTKEEAEDIAFALDIWVNPAPGYDGPDDWMSEYYPLYRDARAVEETLAMLRQPENAEPLLASFLAQNVKINQAFDDVYWNKTTPMEGLEAQKPIWEAELEKYNK